MGLASSVDYDEECLVLNVRSQSEFSSLIAVQVCVCACVCVCVLCVFIASPYMHIWAYTHKLAPLSDMLMSIRLCLYVHNAFCVGVHGSEPSNC